MSKSLECLLEPIHKPLLPLAGIRVHSRGVATKAVAASGIARVEVRYVSRCEGTVEQDAVLPLHDGVVLAVEQEDGRAVGRDVQLEGHGVAHDLPVLAVLSEQGSAAAFVDVGLVHRHDGIDGSHEVGPQADGMLDAEGRQEVRSGIRGSTHAEMTAGREAHDAEALGIDAEVGGVLTNILNRTLDVAEGVGMAVTAADETRMEDVGSS